MKTIDDACAERCWFIETFATGVCIWTGDDAHHANGTDAIAWCKAYAKACQEGGAA